MEDMLNMLPIEGARALAQAGVIKHVRLAASGEGFNVEINRNFIVATRKNEPRIFSKADTALSWLNELGVTKIHEVDLSNWRDGGKAETQ